MTLYGTLVLGVRKHVLKQMNKSGLVNGTECGRVEGLISFCLIINHGFNGSGEDSYS